MKKRILLFTLGLCALSVGCQKATKADGVVELSGTNSALSCKPGSQKVNSDNLEIEGPSVGSAGQAVSYKLNESLSCDSSEEVIWKSAGGGTFVGSSVSSVYKKAGTYVLTAKVQDSSTSMITQELSYKTVVASDSIVIAAPQVGVVGQALTFELAVPSNITLLEAYWTFGDGTPSLLDKGPLQHTYTKAGTYQLKVVAVGNPGGEKMLTQTITISEPDDTVVCTAAAAISGPAEAKVSESVTLSLYMPQCLADQVGAIRWSFGDDTSASGQTVQHAYATKGAYEVTAVLYKGDSTQVLFTLKHSIIVTEGVVVDPDPEPTPEPEPLACATQGLTRDSRGELYSETVSCGLNGSKEITYHDLIKEQCQVVGEKLKWVEISRVQEMTNEGSCQGQSCKLPDGSVLANGGSKVLYSTQTPAGSCAAVSLTRVCENGVLSGSDIFNQLTCHNGCNDFGSHGTVKTGVVTGEVKVPMICAFGEEGFFDLFNEISDQACTDGQIVTSNTRRGDIKTAGSCPVYSFAPSEEFTACSADCGGKQSRIFVCKDEKGVVVASDRCQGLPPVEERVCDGNPEAVRRQESSSVTEEGNSSAVCPANQIGVVINKREVTTLKTYACLDHQVQLESESVQAGPWVTESYCRDYVARRCSHDSLSITEARGRYEWMVKCQDQLPVVKEFLTHFEDVNRRLSKKASVALDSKGRSLYPSFMNRAFKPEKPWIAPKNKNAPCTMPESAYVATVCVSSCATPEQLILAEEAANSKMKYVPFIEALTKNYGFVASLQSAQSMGSKDIQKTKVDQWVTELVDSEHDILVFRMKSGRELKVTPNHAVVASNGYMKMAKDFKVGDHLVLVGGVLDPIKSITPIKHQGKVYNVFVKSTAIHHNILVLNGYLNGSAYFQNDGAKNLNRSLFRKAMTEGAF